MKSRLYLQIAHIVRALSVVFIFLALGCGSDNGGNGKVRDAGNGPTSDGGPKSQDASAKSDQGAAGSGGNLGQVDGSAGRDGGSPQAGSGGSGGAGGASGSGGAIDSGAIDSGSTTSGDSGWLENNNPECASADDCRVYTDCCNCVALSKNAANPGCDPPGVNCLQPDCDAKGLKGVAAACVAGRCVLGVSCDPMQSACNSLPPDCPAGYAAPLAPDAGCWAGGCVRADQCARVSSCQDCPADQGCVRYEEMPGPSFHCVRVPAACLADRTCECMGASVCVGPYDLCYGSTSQLNCSCPVC